jgi:hypothetical protein
MSFTRRLARTKRHAAANPDYNPPVTPAPTPRKHRSNHKKAF